MIHYMFILLLSLSCYSINFAMQKQPLEAYFKYLPQDLRTQLAPHTIFSIIDDSKNWRQAAFKIDDLYRRGPSIPLFSDLEFTRLIIDYIQKKFTPRPLPSEIAKELTIPGIKLWQEAVEKEKQLLEAAKEGNLSKVQDFIEKQGWDPNKYYAHNLPLEMAAAYGHLPFVQYLLEHGAQVDKRNIVDATALASAAGRGHKEIIKLLLDKGADVNAQDDVGNTALMSAAVVGHKEIVELLLERGADRTLKNYRGQTALDEARSARKEGVVTLLEQ